MKYFKFLLVLIFLCILNLCSQSNGYGFHTNKEISNVRLSMINEDIYLKDLNAKGYIFFFGYSRCTTTCAMGLLTLNNLATDSNLPKGIIPIFISIDLHRDSKNKLRQLSKNYGDNIIFVLPNSETELRKITKDFEVQFSKSNPWNPNYEINHTGSIYFVDSNYRMVRVFTSNQRDTKEINNEINKYYQGNNI